MLEPSGVRSRCCFSRVHCGESLYRPDFSFRSFHRNSRLSEKVLRKSHLEGGRNRTDWWEWESMCQKWKSNVLLVLFNIISIFVTDYHAIYDDTKKTIVFNCLRLVWHVFSNQNGFSKARFAVNWLRLSVTLWWFLPPPIFEKYIIW